MIRMKQKYITPNNQAINIQSHNIIAISLNINDSNNGGDDEEGGYNPEGSLSRENDKEKDVWKSHW